MARCKKSIAKCVIVAPHRWNTIPEVYWTGCGWVRGIVNAKKMPVVDAEKLLKKMASDDCLNFKVRDYLTPRIAENEEVVF